jgi:hypothetical protein
MTSSLSTYAWAFSVTLTRLITNSGIYFWVLKYDLTFLSEFNAFATMTVISWLLILVVHLNSWNFVLLLVCEPGFEFVRNSYLIKIDSSSWFVSTFNFTKNSFISSLSRRIVINLTSIVESSIFSFWFSKLNTRPKDSIVMLISLLPTVSNNLIIFLIED